MKTISFLLKTSPHFKITTLQQATTLTTTVSLFTAIKTITITKTVILESQKKVNVNGAISFDNKNDSTVTTTEEISETNPKTWQIVFLVDKDWKVTEVRIQNNVPRI